MSARTVSTETAFRQFNDIMARDGLRPALAYLVGLTDFRYIAIFRRNGERAAAAAYYDREHPDVLAIDEVPASATYCQLAIESRAPFVTANAPEDPRLVSHPARHAVQAYSGVPLMTPEGELLGTLCHYDVVPRDPAQVDLELIVTAASAIEQRGLVPPYPAHLSPP
jgi:GAF domain-containing protein